MTYDPNIPRNNITPTGRIQTSHGVEFIIHGDDMQFVEMLLDPGEVAIGEAGAMMYMEQGIQMETKMSDGGENSKGVFGKVMGAAKRSMAGEKMFMTFYTNNGHGKLNVAFAAPYPGEIIPIDLNQLGGMIYCQKEGYLCGTSGVNISLGFTKRIGAGMFGGEGYILQKLSGTGLAFIHAGGSVIEKDLSAGQTLYVDTGSVVGFQGSVTFDVKMVQGVANMMFGGEDLFLSTLTGPGKVWIQSMPYFRLVSNIKQTMLDTRTRKEKKAGG